MENSVGMTVVVIDWSEDAERFSEEAVALEPTGWVTKGVMLTWLSCCDAA